MTVLGIDTSTSLVSMGLVEQKRVLGEITFQGERRHLGKLIPWLSFLLREAAVTLNQVGAIACVVGPGSFTGLRIGLATVQGISLAMRLPVVALCSLDVFAAGLSALKVCALIRSRGDTFFYAHYQKGVREGTVGVAPLAEIVACLPAMTTIASPDMESERGRISDLLSPLQSGVELMTVGASGVKVAGMGEVALARGEVSDPLHLTANYFRESFAEEKTPCLANAVLKSS